MDEEVLTHLHRALLRLREHAERFDLHGVHCLHGARSRRQLRQAEQPHADSNDDRDGDGSYDLHQDWQVQNSGER